jgi:hypothetical protein
LLSHFSVFRKQKQLLLIQTPVCLLISVFSASKSSFDLFKPQFAFSFWCFPQAKAALTYSNPSLLSFFGVLRNKTKKRRDKSPSLAIGCKVMILPKALEDV